MRNLLYEHLIKSGDSFVEDASITFADDGAIMYVDPPETMFGYLYYSHLIPPFKPKEMLILGYGNGTIAELTRKIWGAVSITGVDLMKLDFKYIENKICIMDAKDFVWSCTDSIIKKRFDYIAIDLWNGKGVPDFIFETEFVVRLSEMCKRLVGINIRESDLPRTKSYMDYGFQYDRFVPIEGNRVMFWSKAEKE